MTNATIHLSKISIFPKVPPYAPDKSLHTRPLLFSDCEKVYNKIRSKDTERRSKLIPLSHLRQKSPKSGLNSQFQA